MAEYLISAGFCSKTFSTLYFELRYQPENTTAIDQCQPIDGCCECLADKINRE